MSALRFADNVQYSYGNNQIGAGFLALPENPSGDLLPAMVVIQEIWGHNEDIRSITRRFAEQGYATFAPDLYHGSQSLDLEEARKFSAAMQMDVAELELDMAIRYLRSLQDVDKRFAGIIGFCMGGSLAMRMAIRATMPATLEVSAAAIFYGGTPPPKDQDLSMIRCPLFCAYGDQDTGISNEQIESLRTSLRNNHVSSEIHIYPGVGHSFFNSAKPESYNEPAAEQAWQDVLRFFSKH